MVDPPWPIYTTNFKVGGLLNTNAIDYPTMPVKEITKIPVQETFADDAWLFLWTTNRFLPDAFPLMKAWGATYNFTITWV